MTAEDPDDRAAQLTTLTEQLCARLTRETQAFEARRPQDAAAGVAETARLANLYRHESTRLRREPALLDGADPVRVGRLKLATQAFEAVLARHGRALEAAKSVTEGLVRAMAEAAEAARPQSAGYGPGVVRPAAFGGVALNRQA